MTETKGDRVDGGDSPLREMALSTPTCLWNDSASAAELRRAMTWGAVGSTCNPVLALTALKAERSRWHARVQELARQYPLESESALGWRLVRELAVEAAGVLEGEFQKQAGRNGRVSIQTDPRHYRDAAAITQQAIEFSALAPNVIVKIPVTSQGLVAMEEATFAGVSINATVSFTVAQALAVAEAVERGLQRRLAAGLAIDSISSVCTIMVGRLDDYMRALVEVEGVSIDPGHLEWAGIAVFKRAYAVYQERGYRLRLLSAAFRNHMHWSELVGGDVVISPPFPWQERLNASGIAPVPRIHIPVDGARVAELERRIPEFRRAYEVDGLSPEEFLDYGATRRTLRQFLSATADLESFVRDALLPDAP